MFIYSLGTSINQNPKGCITALVHVPRVFPNAVFWGDFVSGFGASVFFFSFFFFSFIYNTLYLYISAYVK